MISQDIEHHRAKWALIAKENGWYRDPLPILIYKNDTGEIKDSVSYRSLQEDTVVYTAAYD